MDKNIESCVSFSDYLGLSKEATNKAGFLVLCFKRLHSNAPKEDFINTGGRIAKLWVLANKDTGYLLEIIWCASAKPCNGSHLNYIQAMLSKPKINTKPQLPTTQLKRVN
jgi:hypothetical protein